MTEQNTALRPPALTQLRVIELSTNPAGEQAGLLFADMGADVVRIEPPSGSDSRRLEPLLKTGSPSEDLTSLHFHYYNRSKQSAVIPDDTTKAEKLEAMLADADIFICTLQPAELKADGIDYEAIRQRFPSLIIIAVTPFGLTGPWADYRATDLTALAGGGMINLSGYDDPGLPPICPGGGQSWHTAASFAYTGGMLALLDRRKTGLGDLVDVAVHDSVAISIELSFLYWYYAGKGVRRQTCRHAMPVPTQPALFQCADGSYVYFVLVLAERKAWTQLVSWLDMFGMAADLGDPRFLDLTFRQEHFQHVHGILECFFLIRTAYEAFHEGQERQLPIGILYAPEDLVDDPHLRERGFFQAVETAGTQLTYPGSTQRFSAFGGRAFTPAPRLGEQFAGADRGAGQVRDAD